MGSIPVLGRSSRERKGLPTPVFWPGEFHELYSPWGHKKSDMTEQLSLHVNVRPETIKFPGESSLTFILQNDFFGHDSKASGMGIPWWSSS